jgi:pimeloyl-ACP methyl ester carboxylesterase
LLIWLGLVLVWSVFIACSATWRGRGLTLGIALVASVVLLAIPAGWPWRPRRRAIRALIGGALASGALLVLALVATSPTGREASADGLRVEHQFVRPGARFPRFALSNLIPEADQIALGLGLARWLDPHLDAQQARRVRALSMPLYRRQRRDPALAEVGSVLTWAYDDALGRPFHRGHYVAFVPQGGTRQRPLPALVFLHGSAGNFSSYWTLLADLARRRRVLVICPSWGYGEWQRPGGVEAVVSALDHAQRRYPLDERQIYLAALSNGGRGATRVMTRHARRFRGVAFLSAVIETGPLRRAVARGAWRGKRALVVHGTRDRRIPFGRIRARLPLLRRGGAQVELLALRGEDHFLFFARREQVLARLARWIRPTPRSAATAGSPGPQAARGRR